MTKHRSGALLLQYSIYKMSNPPFDTREAIWGKRSRNGDDSISPPRPAECRGGCGGRTSGCTLRGEIIRL